MKGGWDEDKKFEFELFQIRESFESLDTGVEPLAEIVLCCGFFLIYFVEEVVHICFSGSVTDKSEGRSESTESIVRGSRESIVNG